ncbi:PilZ domain-containing protein [Methylomarinum sp. Ch1-1]|uniref:Cyclic diguanosine monophosphate-binding protein n=1 Tax=Methylomarinum roseum TaxID=3067653 RepID=A0AAU7NTP4_9GAMM|nr:PilZ domain-containing protein [Methylomarinum sp. Ch1-1]MDP4519618.1 PilZ domain-containing protein [Methylomarinum sp. Ch1-1]
MNLDKNEDKRRFHRILYDADANLSGSQGSYHCKTLDLSLKGCLLSFDRPWSEELGQLHTLTLQLSDSISISMELSVSHVIGNEVGFKCEHIDVDSITELRRLLELNIGDSALLERDLLSLSEVNTH